MKSILLLSCVLLFSSCAAMKADWIAQNCSEDAAYSNDVGDAQSGKDHDASTYSICEGHKIGELKKSYSKGFSSINNNPLHFVSDLLTGKKYHCEISIFTKSYVGISSSKSKAKRRAMDKCTKDHNEMHCDRFECNKK